MVPYPLSNDDEKLYDNGHYLCSDLDISHNFCENHKECDSCPVDECGERVLRAAEGGEAQPRLVTLAQSY